MDAKSSDAVPIPSLPGYFATPDGRVIAPHGREVRPTMDYPRVLIQPQGAPRTERRRLLAHKLIAEAFLGPRPDGHDVDHIDGNRANNSIENLRYLSVADNRGRNPGVAHHGLKTHCPQGHPYNEENTYTWTRGTGQVGRHCRVCRASHSRTAAAKRRSTSDGR